MTRTRRSAPRHKATSAAVRYLLEVFPRNHSLAEPGKNSPSTGPHAVTVDAVSVIVIVYSSYWLPPYAGRRRPVEENQSTSITAEIRTKETS